MCFIKMYKLVEVMLFAPSPHKLKKKKKKKKFKGKALKAARQSQRINKRDTKKRVMYFHKILLISRNELWISTNQSMDILIQLSDK